MACACKVNRQIDFLHRKYGTKTPQSKKTNISSTVKLNVEKLFLGVLIIIFSPLFLLHILYTRIVRREKAIRIDKLFHLSK